MSFRLEMQQEASGRQEKRKSKMDGHQTRERQQHHPVMQLSSHSIWLLDRRQPPGIGAQQIIAHGDNRLGLAEWDLAKPRGRRLLAYRVDQKINTSLEQHGIINIQHATLTVILKSISW